MCFFIKKTLAKICLFYLICAPFYLSLNANVFNNENVFILEKWEFVNNHFLSDKKLGKLTGFSKGVLVSDAKITDVTDRIKNEYKSEGFCFVQVDIIKNLDDFGNLKLLCEIVEGKRVKINEIKFSGNMLVKSKDLKKVLKSQSNNFFRKKYFEENMINEDKKMIENFYKNNNLGESRVSEVVKNFSSNGEKVDITYIIEESLNKSALTYMDSNEASVDKLDEIITVNKNNENVIDDNSASETLGVQITPKKDQIIEPLEENVEKENAQIVEDSSSDIIKAKQDVVEENLIISQLKKEIQNLTIVVKEKEEVESLLSGILSSEKIEKRKLLEEVSKNQLKIKDLEQLLKNEQVEKEKMRQQYENKLKEQESLITNNAYASQKAANISNIIDNKLKDIENLRDHLTVILNETRNAISNELDKIELTEISVIKEKEDNKIEINNKIENKITDKSVVEKYNNTIINGKVLVVNDSLNFVVINVGASKGVYKDMIVEFSRNDKIICTGKVIEIRKNISAVDVLTNKNSISVGDLVFEKIIRNN